MTVWHSQAGQDEWIVKMTGGLRGGYFLNVGAYDGVESDNTLALERDYGWTGVCVEANPEYADACRMNRPLTDVWNVAVAEQAGQMGFLHQWPSDAPGVPIVRCVTLDTIVRTSRAPAVIDYLSLDVEGFELRALQGFTDLDRVRFLTVEHNLYVDGPALKDQLYAHLTERYFVRVVDNAAPADGPYAGCPFEDWYCHERETPAHKLGMTQCP